MTSKYFIMAWDDDSQPKRYYDFYFVADKNGNLLLFDSIKDAEGFGRKCCKYFRIDNWHDYMMGKETVDINRLTLHKNIT